MTRDYRWIRRQIADEIYNKILSQSQEEKNGVHVYLVEAPAGAGKTFLARDIGVRLGSRDGYGPGEKQGILWSGILDLYDPDTNSNRGIEQLLIRAFSQDPLIEFKKYYDQRQKYVNMSLGGTGGPPLEEQRRTVENTFASELRKIASRTHLVWAFDTIERLESAFDPTEAELGELGQLEDTASVTGWLLDQIARLPRATILLFGRETKRFKNRLNAAILEANYDRDKSIGTIKFEVKDVSILTEDEVQDFFAFQEAKYSKIKKVMTNEIRDLLTKRTGSNPLLLDIALQTILETGGFDTVRDALAKKGEISEVGKVLLKAYMNHGSPERRTLLGHLALARNGLTIELLQALEPRSFTRLEAELGEVAKLPFVKTRRISTSSLEKNKQSQRPTFFLHDAMYVICDEVLLKPAQARNDCKTIVKWYQTKIDESLGSVAAEPDSGHDPDSIERRDDPISDLLVESLFYRLRADPKEGYTWYLEQADSAFRAVKAGFEMRLRDSMAQFAVSANPKGENDSANSRIDRANIKTFLPDLWQQFKIDSAMMWVRRLSFRGRHQEAIRVAEKAVWAEEIYRSDPDSYCLSLAELGVWQAQSLMYLGRASEAIRVYRKNLDLLAKDATEDLQANKSQYAEPRLKRIAFVKGRTLNNLGYTYWMYFGKNKAALSELLQAIEYFKIAGLAEEEANSLDNMGRIHAVLWHQPAARLLIESGLKKREEEQNKYRVALSQISLASIQHRFGNGQLALENANKAFKTFSTMNVERGKGLAYLTRAMINRSMAEAWRENGLSLERAVEITNEAIEDLEQALQIFKASIQETIRYVYVLNELGSCYRCLYLLRTYGEAPEREKTSALKQGVYYFTEAIQNADRYDYFIEKFDSKQDLAVLYFRAHENDKATLELAEIVDKIPADYRFQAGRGLKDIPELETTDAYYKLMGQVELLTGAIIFDRQIKTGINLQSTLNAVEHYLLGIAYYYRYSSVSSNTYNAATERIYKRLSRCDRSIITAIRKQHLDELIHKYCIPAEWAEPLFSEIFVMLGA